jgi:hypothetical protein
VAGVERTVDGVERTVAGSHRITGRVASATTRFANSRGHAPGRWRTRSGHALPLSEGFPRSGERLLEAALPTGRPAQIEPEEAHTLALGSQREALCLEERRRREAPRLAGVRACPDRLQSPAPAGGGLT